MNGGLPMDDGLRTRVDMRSLRTPGADPRFAVSQRGPYWRPGDSVLAEPWVALGETNTGHAAIRCGRSRETAAALVARWAAVTAAMGPGMPDPSGRVVVGAALVDPQGRVVDSWGDEPVPGGAPRWRELRRLLVASTCARCRAERWVGCWVAADGDGCAECLPAAEVADPRLWPSDPIEPAELAKPKRSTRSRKVVAVMAQAAPEGQSALL